MERIVERNDPAAWKAVIEDAEDKLVSWKHRSNKGNLCGEIERDLAAIRAAYCGRRGLRPALEAPIAFQPPAGDQAR